MEQESEYYTASEAARALRVSRTTIWRWIGEGRLAAYQVGGRTLRIRREDVKRALRPVVYGPRHPEGDALRLGYEPAAAKEGLRQATGILRGVDTGTLKKEIRESRERGGVPADTSIVERTAGVFNRREPPLTAEELRAAAELAFTERDNEPAGP